MENPRNGSARRGQGTSPVSPRSLAASVRYLLLRWKRRFGRFSCIGGQLTEGGTWGERCTGLITIGNGADQVSCACW